jgi:hypothetical protein
MIQIGEIVLATQHPQKNILLFAANKRRASRRFLQAFLSNVVTQLYFFGY